MKNVKMYYLKIAVTWKCFNTEENYFPVSNSFEYFWKYATCMKSLCEKSFKPKGPLDSTGQRNKGSAQTAEYQGSRHKISVINSVYDPAKYLSFGPNPPSADELWGLIMNRPIDQSRDDPYKSKLY